MTNGHIFIIINADKVKHGSKQLKREIIADSLIIGLGLILLTVGVIEQMVFPIGYISREPNVLILVTEICGFVAISGLGIERLAHDTKKGFREIMGDIIIIGGGMLVAGMFITILFKSQFQMYQAETVFVLARFIATCGICVLGFERMINDVRHFSR